MSNQFRNKLLVSTLLAGVAALAAPAQAQQPQTSNNPNQAPDAAGNASVAGQAGADNAAATTTNDVVVTGTLIRNPNLTSSSPVNVVNEAEIALRAPNNAEEAIRSLPGVVPGIGTQVNNGATGINTVDLRGLGSQRNLVLLDGNRLVPSNAAGNTDLNIIPLALVQRVDVLTGGASTTYGADAVSGVVNFITRRDFTGLDARASYALTERGDGASRRGDLTLGANFADDKGNAVISVGYTKADPVYQVRPYALFGVSSTSGAASGASFTSVPTTISFADADRQVNPAGTALQGQYQGFNFNPYNIFQTPIDRKSLYAAARYDVADGIEVYARGMFVNNSIQQIIAPSGIFGQPLTIPGNNPYLPTAIRDELCTRAGIALGATCNTNTAIPLPAVYRRAVEVGPRIANFENNVYDLRVGARFDLTSDLNLDVNGSYGRTELTTNQSGYVLTSRVQQALNATNTTTCTVTTNNCVPLNLFGPAGSITPAQVGFLSGGSTSRVNVELKQVRAVLAGGLGGFQVPFASQPVSFALGGEHREYVYQRQPDAIAQNPVELGGSGGAVTPFSGGYQVSEGFGELIVPIVNDRPFFQELTLEGGVRYSHYSIQAPGNPSFNATTYKGGVTFEPVESLRFRGNYQRASRAPNIGELFTPVSTGLTNLTVDPCAGAAPATNANLAAICIAQGAPAASIGLIQNPSAGQANGTGGGNVNLRPEKADTVTAGVVITPRGFLPGFNLSVDYYNIIVRDAITAATPGDVIAACFSNITAASATSAACTGIRRSTANGRLSGSAALIAGLPLPLTNNGRLRSNGIDLTANYQRTIGQFGLNLNFVGNYTRKLEFQAAGTSVNRNCVGYYSSNCGPSLGQIQPKYSFQQRTTLSVEGASLSLLWRYINPVNYEGQASDYVARGFTAANRNLFRGTITNAANVSSALAGQTVDFNHIRAYHYFDLSAQFDVARQFQLTFTVKNLFDVEPPVVGGQAGTTTANGGNTFPSTYDPLGRDFAVGLRIKL